MDYFDMLEGPAEPEPGQDELRAIVARAGRRRWRVLGTGVAAALVAGGAIGGAVGYSASNHSKGSVQTASSPAASASGSKAALTQPGFAPATLPGESAPYPASAPQLTALFFRTANGVDIRAYAIQLPPLYSGCGATKVVSTIGLEAEVSNSKAVGHVSSVGSSTYAEVFGTAEHDPATIVIARVAGDVAQVRATFPGGVTDSMAPIGRWAVLAGPAPSAKSSEVGALRTYDASGHQLGAQDVRIGAPGPPALPQPEPACFSCTGTGGVAPGAPLAGSGAQTFACPAVPPTSKGGTIGSGSAGTGTIGAGTPAAG